MFLVNRTNTEVTCHSTASQRKTGEGNCYNCPLSSPQLRVPGSSWDKAVARGSTGQFQEASLKSYSCSDKTFVSFHIQSVNTGTA